MAEGGRPQEGYGSFLLLFTYLEDDRMELGTLIRELCSGMLVSLEIFVLTLVFSLPLGLLVAFGRMSKISPIRWLTKIYISIMRGTPLMLQLMVVYFGPYYIFGIRISSGYRLTAVLIGFAINYAAYFAEIYRGGIEAIPTGQYEAARVLGYSKAQTFFRIIFPQVIKHILPPVTNEVITLVKDTALVTAIGVAELLKAAKDANNRDVNPTAFFLAAVIYLILTFVLTLLSQWCEKRFSRHEQKEA